MPEPYVLRIELDDAAKSDLGRITKELQVDTGDAIGTALGMEAFLLEQVGDGKRVVVIDKAGGQRELMVKMRAGTDGGRGDRSR
ncbi:MAG: hypothetical protein ACREE2_00815 [Stellaceae bacterium]